MSEVKPGDKELKLQVMTLCEGANEEYYSKEIQNAQIQMLNPIYTFWSLLYFFFASGEEKGRIHLRNIQEVKFTGLVNCPRRDDG